MEKAKIYFPWAAQPDIVRAHQKDQFYKKQFQESTSSVLQKLLGSFVAEFKMM
jgi:hypothetical protein